MTWRDISTAPKDGTPCLFYSKTHGQVAGRIPPRMAHYKKVEAVAAAGGACFRPSMWQPLPEPPTTDKTTKDEE